MLGHFSLAANFTFKKVYDSGQTFDLIDHIGMAIEERNLSAKDQYSSLKRLSTAVFYLLVVLLATKNVEKKEVINRKLAAGKFNRSKAYRKDYPITTTLTIGKITENHESVGTGSTVRPHLRRGHIRNQHYGPNNEMTKKIFIQPVFVNADEGWVANREAYNVRMAS